MTTDPESLPKVRAYTGSGSTSEQIQGNVAHDAADAGNPVKIGAVARSSQLTAVTALDRVDLAANRHGELVIFGSTISAPPVGNLAAPVDYGGTPRALAVVSLPGGGAPSALTNSTSTAEEASRVVKASAGTLYGFSFYNNNAATRYVQFFNTASLPADAVIPVITIPVATQQSVHVDFGIYGRRFDTGIVVCNSTTDTAKTIGAADSLFDVQYV